MKQLIMYRSNVVDATPRGMARRLVFVLPSHRILGGIENAEDDDLIPYGDYPVFMILMRRRGSRALWIPSSVVGVENSQLCVHAANYADQLKGCAAPGTPTGGGVGASGAAMDSIFTSLGGFIKDEPVLFSCRRFTEEDQACVYPALYDGLTPTKTTFAP